MRREVVALLLLNKAAVHGVAVLQAAAGAALCRAIRRRAAKHGGHFCIELLGGAEEGVFGGAGGAGQGAGGSQKDSKGWGS